MNGKIWLFMIPLLFSLVAGLPAIVSAQAQEGDYIAAVIQINGSLEYRESSAAEWKPARKMLKLQNGYQLRTGLGNRAMIVYTSGTRVLINENTEIEITSVSPGKQRQPSMERTKIILGEVFSNVKTNKPYEVETPSAVASVRGTQFNSTYGNGEANFLVLENVVEVMNQLGSVLLQQFQMTTVGEGQAPQQPLTLSKKDAEKKISWTATVDPTWRLNLVPQGGETQEIGKSFTLSIWAMKRETGVIDTGASFTLTSLTGDSNIIEFSVDGGKNWTGAPSVTLSGGQVSLLARGTGEGRVVISTRAPDCEVVDIAIAMVKAKQTKTMEMNFVDPNNPNNKGTLIIDLKEK